MYAPTDDSLTGIPTAALRAPLLGKEGIQGWWEGRPGVADIKSNLGGTRGATSPWCLLIAGWDLLCAVDDSKDVDLIRLDVIDDSKGAFHDLPDLGDPEFRDLAPR